MLPSSTAEPESFIPRKAVLTEIKGRQEGGMIAALKAWSPDFLIASIINLTRFEDEKDMNLSELKAKPTSELLALYNSLAEKALGRFKTRGEAEKRTAEKLKEKGDWTGKLPAADVAAEPIVKAEKALGKAVKGVVQAEKALGKAVKSAVAPAKKTAKPEKAVKAKKALGKSVKSAARRPAAKAVKALVPNANKKLKPAAAKPEKIAKAAKEKPVTGGKVGRGRPRLNPSFIALGDLKQRMSSVSDRRTVWEGLKAHKNGATREQLETYFAKNDKPINVQQVLWHLIRLGLAKHNS